jgi:tetratricopeptide (TPR) repeat protein
MKSLRCAALAVLLFPATAVTQVQQAGSAIPPGTMALANLPPGAREAAFAAIDARQTWQWMAAHEHTNRALALDSTFGLARLLRIDLSGAQTVALANAEYQRASADAANRAVGEATYLSGLRSTGVNSTRLLATAREMLPNDRRVALDHVLSIPGQTRIDSLRAMVRQYPDFVAPRIWLSYYLAFNYYVTSPQGLYEALLVAEAAMRMSPNVANTHAALGWALMMNGRLDEAAGHLEAAVKMDRLSEVAHNTLANVYIRDGKPRGVDRARAAYDSAIVASPNVLRDLNYRREKAFMLFYDGRKAEGMTELAGVAKDYEGPAAGTAAVVYAQMAGLAAGTGDSASVDKWAAEARRAAPNANVTVQLTQAYALAKNGPAARRELNEYIRRAADTTALAYRADLRRLGGMTLVAEGKYAEGLAELKRADIPGNPFAELSMIDAYNALNRKAEASALLADVAGRKTVFNSAISIAIANYRVGAKPAKR